MHQIFLESHHLKNKNFGFGQFNYHLIKEMLRYSPNDFQFTIHAKNIASAKKDFGTHPKYKPYYSLRRKRFFQIRKKYDLWHSLNQNTKIEPYHDLPYLLTIHNTSRIKDPESYKHLDSFKRLQSKINRSTAITYISHFAKKATHEFYEIPNIPEYVIYNGNTLQDSTIPTDFQSDFRIKKPFLFSIGQITKRKNFGSLVKMLRHLPDFQLVIAGKKTTEEAQEIQKLIKNSNLEDRISLPGKISTEQKKYFYKHCEAFVFPSFREGFGLPLVEAMNFGTPIFASKNTSLPEIGGEQAFYWNNFDPEEMSEKLLDGLNQFYKNPEFYRQKLQERSQLFSWSKAAKQYLDVYENLLK
jgi:glycosyltransferase involved in cell wall biosynthesis